MKLNNTIVTSIIANDDYGVCYEPIVSLKSMQIEAYEALSRFKYKGKNIPPDIFFRSIHNDLDLFFQIETVLKKFQLANRPDNKKLTLNLDPDITKNLDHISFWVKLFNSQENIAIEIIENSDEENAQDVEFFMDWMDEYNIEYVYDDYAKPNSMFFTSLLCRAKNIKLDISFLKIIKSNPAYIEIAKGITNYAKKANKKTVLEGVEDIVDLDLAKEIGVDCIQGYLFKKDFIYKWKNE